MLTFQTDSSVYYTEEKSHFTVIILIWNMNIIFRDCYIWINIKDKEN